MPKMIQVRNVPDAAHRLLKSRAAGMGLTLSEYVLRSAVRAAETPTDEEILARFAALEPVHSEESSVEVLHAVRAERDAQLGRLAG
ncbi:hypothetical protein tb265_06020 [Gemmatimonadetes bacterium T265]|nr:hypothetical protein tb265_06020 [Gemmatimonadetes bacterium T265]